PPAGAAPGRSGAAPRAREPAPQGSLCKAGRRSQPRLPGPDAFRGPAREDLLDAEPLHRLPRRRERIARPRALQHDDHRLPTYAAPAHVVAAWGRQHNRSALDPRARGAVRHHEGHLGPAPRAPRPPWIGPPCALPIAGVVHLIRLIQSGYPHTCTPANSKLHQRIPMPQAWQSWHPLTRSGKPSILSGSVGWTARLGAESEPLGSEPRPQGEERDARPYRPAHVPLAHRGAARWSALCGSGSSPGSRVTPPGRQVAGIDRRPEKPAGK